jgi:hypothetical protein
MWFFLIPVLILGAALLLFLVIAVLSRYKNGALLRPIIAWLSKIGFMRRFFTRMSTAMVERQNPELASAIKKMNTVANNPNNPQAVQKAMSRLTAAERRAYFAAQEEQGAIPPEANRQMRRQAERMQQQARGGRPNAGGGSSSRKRKKR